MGADPSSGVSPEARQTLQQKIAELRAVETQRLQQAYLLPINGKGVLASNAYLEALADVESWLTPLPPAPPTDEEVVVAELAACDAVIAHIWDLASRYDSDICNAIRDPIARLNSLTRPSIHDLGARLAKASAPLPPAAPPDWQPIGTAPTDGRYLLLTSPAHGLVIGAHVTGDVWHLVGVGAITGISERPTHWMPLPAPPAAGLPPPRPSEKEKP